MRWRLAFGPRPESYDEAFMETMASQYLERTPWTRLRLAAVEDLVEPRPGDRVLDIGCAAGAVTHFLSTHDCEVVGVDLEPLAVEKASALFPELRFVQADAAALPFENASFDKAVAADLVEHLDDGTFAAMLAEARRVLVPGGTLSVYTPNREHLIERLKAHDLILAGNPTHVAVRSAGELAAALELARFAVERNEWRPSLFRTLRPLERALGPVTSFLRYRLLLRGRKPA
jgi:SAM-dependent methyltransferase